MLKNTGLGEFWGVLLLGAAPFTRPVLPFGHAVCKAPSRQGAKQAKNQAQATLQKVQQAIGFVLP